MPRGLRQAALSISFLSPIFRRPAAFAVTKIASLIFRPERRFLALTSFQSLMRPKFEFREFFFDLPAQAIFGAFSRALAATGKHPKTVALASYEQHPSAFRSHQFRGFCHSNKAPSVESIPFS